MTLPPISILPPELRQIVLEEYVADVHDHALNAPDASANNVHGPEYNREIATHRAASAVSCLRRFGSLWDSSVTSVLRDRPETAKQACASTCIGLRNRHGAEFTQGLNRLLGKFRNIKLGHALFTDEQCDAMLDCLAGGQALRSDLLSADLELKGDSEKIAAAIRSVSEHGNDILDFKLNLSRSIGADDNIDSIAAALGTSRVTNLELRDNYLNAGDAATLANGLQGSMVETLDLNGNRIGAEGARAVVAALPGTSVRTLHMRGNNLSADAIIAIADALNNPDANFDDAAIETIDLALNPGCNDPIALAVLQGAISRHPDIRIVTSLFD